MKKVKLDNTGVLVKRSYETSVVRQKISDPRPIKPRVQPITTDFVREVKDELVKELADLLLKAGLGMATRVIFSKDPDETLQESVTITKPILIDDSIVVTEVSVGHVEKGFDQLTETKVAKDEQVSSSISKLRSMKKGN